MTRWSKFWYCGLWAIPLTIMGLLLIIDKTGFEITWDFESIFSFTVISVLPALYIYATNLGKYLSGQRDFGLLTAFDLTPTQYSNSHRISAMYPPVPFELRQKEPTGIIFGKQAGRYVCRSLIDGIAHMLIIGGSGSGKSSCIIIPMLLANSDKTVFAIDIKGELSYKSTELDGDCLIINPNDRGSYGYDVYYQLRDKPSSQDVTVTMLEISLSLIGKPASAKDPFWINSARNLLTGLLIYNYKIGNEDFISAIDVILGKPIKELISEALSNSKPTSSEYRYLVQFGAMPDETLSGVYAEMANHLTVFANDQDLRYSLKINPRKASPQHLMDGKSTYLCISEEKLTRYNGLLRVIINQTLSEVETRPENSKQILFIIDELARLVSGAGASKIEKLMDSLKTARSRNCILILVTQSVEALESAYSPAEVADLISNCEFVEILSAKSSKTQKAVCDWCGKYREKKLNWSGTVGNRKISTTYDEKAIVNPSDLITLQASGEAILISPYGYNRIKKVPYYTDTYFRERAERIRKHNDKLISIKGG